VAEEKLQVDILILYVFFMGQTHLPGGRRQKRRKMKCQEEFRDAHP